MKKLIGQFLSLIILTSFLMISSVQGGAFSDLPPDLQFSFRFLKRGIELSDPNGVVGLFQRENLNQAITPQNIRLLALFFQEPELKRFLDLGDEEVQRIKSQKPIEPTTGSKEWVAGWFAWVNQIYPIAGYQPPEIPFWMRSWSGYPMIRKEHFLELMEASRNDLSLAVKIAHVRPLPLFFGDPEKEVDLSRLHSIYADLIHLDDSLWVKEKIKNQYAQYQQNRYLVSDELDDILVALAGNPFVPQNLLGEVVKKVQDRWFHSSVYNRLTKALVLLARNPNTPLTFFEQIAMNLRSYQKHFRAESSEGFHFNAFLEAIGSNPSLKRQTLELFWNRTLFVDSKYWEQDDSLGYGSTHALAEGLVRNPNTPKEWLDLMAEQAPVQNEYFWNWDYTHELRDALAAVYSPDKIGLPNLLKNPFQYEKYGFSRMAPVFALNPYLSLDQAKEFLKIDRLMDETANKSKQDLRWYSTEKIYSAFIKNSGLPLDFRREMIQLLEERSKDAQLFLNLGLALSRKL